MRAALHPAGIVAAHTLPVLLLGTHYASMLQVIHPLLDAESIAAWKRLALIGGGSVLAFTAYATWAWIRRMPVQALYAALVFIVYVPLLSLIGSSMNVLFPWDVPRWMMPENAELYAFRLLSLPLGHALFVGVASSLPEGKRGAPLRDFLIAAAIPLFAYLFVQVVEPFRHSSDFEQHAWVVVLVCLTIGFLFLIMRGTYALVRHSGPRPVWRAIVVVLISLILPLLGLLLNNGVITGIGRDAGRVFGDLSHPAFYIIAVLNATVLLWPSSQTPSVRFLQFVLRAIGFTYVLYFFILFLPLLPLSIVAIIAFGLGFLMLSPIMLFVLQFTVLITDLRFLQQHRSRPSLAAYILASMSVLPAAIGMRYLHHRMVLRDALHHVFSSDPKLYTQPLDESALAAVLAQIDANRSRWIWSNRSTPFLTPLYNRIVLDNLQLSREKAALLSRIFMDTVPQNDEMQAPRGRVMPPSNSTSITWSKVESMYDEAAGAWRSHVHLRIANSSSGREEFVTRFRLPDGAWVTGQYLVIGADTVPGILAEEKAASWVYANIVSYRQDPSLMRRVSPHDLELRVFPVEPRGERSTGFDVLHKETCTIVVGNDTLRLGDGAHALPPEPVVGTGVAYLPSTLKETLPLVTRATHHHLVVDGTEGTRALRENAIERLTAFIEHERLDTAHITLHIADAYGESLPFGAKALSAFRHHAGHGGFFTDRVIRKVLSDACLNPADSRPLVVIIPSISSEAVAAAGILLDDLSDVAECIPEGDGFLMIAANGEVNWRSFAEPNVPLTDSIVHGALVRAWPDAKSPRFYLSDNGEGEIIVDVPHLQEHNAVNGTDWSKALELEGRYRAFLHRSDGTRFPWLSIVRGSFAQQVLMPVTAWMCLENEAQRNALLRKQEQVLASDANLDTMDEEITSMSEPGLLWFMIPLLLWLAWPAIRRSSGA